MGTARSVGIALDRALSPISDEAALVAELQAGSEEAFVYLMSVYQNPMFNVVSHIVADGSDAGDVLQEVFIKIFKGIRQFRGGSSLKTWIYRIAVHEALNHRRGWLRRHRRETFSFEDGQGDSVMALEEVQSNTETPYQALELSERRELLLRGLSSLAQPYRAVVVLREIEGLTYDEIAQVLGVAEGTVKSRLMRGRELLRRKLASLLVR
jgi:RNA polymerase sigma-70 factor (ECF subfamily)